jgi:SWI/SNF-related matrix-associated actin-dependent regulator of chromatin subfamily A protein 2/4
VLKGDAAPNADELEDWLEKNPGFEVISRDAASDSENDSEDEPLVRQPVEDDINEDEFEGLDEEQRNKRIIEKAQNEEDEYDIRNKARMESYYATAHKIKEKIVKPPTLLGGGDPDLQLKPYQVIYSLHLLHFSNLTATYFR